MIRTRVYEQDFGETLNVRRLLVMVEDWPDGSQTIAFKFPDVFDGAVWGPPLNPVREEVTP